MKFNSLTSFAAGIFLATSIFGVVYLSATEEPAASEEAEPEQIETLTEDEMKAILEAKGYLVQLPEGENDEDVDTEDAGDSDDSEEQNSGEEQNSDQNEQEETEDIEEEADDNEEPTQLVITVEPGMTSIDVGRRLHEANLIDKDPFSFSKDIESRNLQNKLFPGTYTVNSSMSYDELIDAIFNQR